MYSIKQIKRTRDICMKKRLAASILTVCLVVGMLNLQEASAYEERNVNNEEPFRTEHVSNPKCEIPYIPFIYDEQYAEFDIFSDWIRDTVKYEAGKVYVTDPETESTYKLDGIPDAREEVLYGDYVFFVVGLNEIISVDINTWETKTLYKGEGSRVFDLAVSDELICFIENDEVCILNRESGKICRFGKFENIRVLFMLTNKRFAWIDERDEAWEYDIRTGENKRVDYELYFTGEPVETIDASKPEPTKSILQSGVTPGPYLPLSEYSRFHIRYCICRVKTVHGICKICIC